MAKRSPKTADAEWTRAICEVLKINGPTHYTDIAEKIISGGLVTKPGQNPVARVANHISTLRKKSDCQIEKTASGTYGLKGSGSLISKPEEIADEQKAEAGIIGAFGMFWDRSKIDWTVTSPVILGSDSAGGDPVDFAIQQGLYILYRDSNLVYVGMTTDSLGERLKAHTRQRMKNRWNSFSWFGLLPVGEKGIAKKASLQKVDVKDLAITLEAVMIEAIEPPLCRQRGQNLEALEWFQVEDPGIVEKREQEIVQRRMQSSFGNAK